MTTKNLPMAKLSGTVRILSSKSDGQRALLCAALSNGISRIKNSGSSKDVLDLLEVIQQMGAIVEKTRPNELKIQGTQKFPLKETFSVGESGLGMRLIVPICAAHTGEFIITGEGSILKRTHNFFIQELPAFGVDVSSQNGFPPIQIIGKMQAGNYVVDGSQSSQFISGLLLALPLLEGDSILKVDDLVSKSYVQMTLNTLEKFGVKINTMGGSKFSVKGSQSFISCDYQVESDWSSASYWLVASALGHDVKISNLNKLSDQPDKKIVEIFEQATCSIETTDEIITINGFERIPFTCDLKDCPDLFPALTVLAAFCPGKSVIKGAGRLKNKESDRGLALQSELGKLGVEIELLDDEMIIHGQNELKSSIVKSHGDHRIAMSLAIAGTFIEGGLKIEHPEVVSKSYPEFWQDLEGLTIR